MQGEILVSSIQGDNHSISTALIKLIEQKTKLDKVEFTASQLAEAIEVSRSVITRLIHKSQDKCVTNPRIFTLIKIVQYFKNQGLDITLDELVGIKSDELKKY